MIDYQNQKTNKYELGTTIEVADEFILTAFTHFDSENKAFLSKGEFLLCLDSLWKEINRIYAQRNINIPLLGSGISRIGNDLKPQDYLEQILNSIKLSDIDNAYNTSINIVLHESIKEHIDLFNIKNKFLKIGNLSQRSVICFLNVLDVQLIISLLSLYSG